MAFCAFSNHVTMFFSQRWAIKRRWARAGCDGRFVGFVSLCFCTLTWPVIPQTVCPHWGVVTVVGVKAGVWSGCPILFPALFFFVNFRKNWLTLVVCPCASRLRRLAQNLTREFCLILVRSILPENPPVKWLFSNVQTHFDCAGSHKT